MADLQYEIVQQPSRRPVRRLFVMLALVVVALDQLTKYLIVRQMVVGDSFPVLGRVLSLTYSRNMGSAMGLVPAGGRTLAIVAGIFVVAIVIWGVHWARRNAWLAWGLGGLLGGALGNLIDRVRLNYVIDFLDVHFWPVFNVADIAVCLGAAAILIGTLLYDEQQGCSPDEKCACEDPEESNPSREQD